MLFDLNKYLSILVNQAAGTPTAQATWSFHRMKLDSFQFVVPYNENATTKKQQQQQRILTCADVSKAIAETLLPLWCHSDFKSSNSAQNRKQRYKQVILIVGTENWNPIAILWQTQRESEKFEFGCNLNPQSAELGKVNYIWKVIWSWGGRINV